MSGRQAAAGGAGAATGVAPQRLHGRDCEALHCGRASSHCCRTYSLPWTLPTCNAPSRTRAGTCKARSGFPAHWQRAQPPSTVQDSSCSSADQRGSGAQVQPAARRYDSMRLTVLLLVGLVACSGAWAPVQVRASNCCSRLLGGSPANHPASQRRPAAMLKQGRPPTGPALLPSGRRAASAARRPPGPPLTQGGDRNPPGVSAVPPALLTLLASPVKPGRPSPARPACRLAASSMSLTAAQCRRRCRATKLATPTCRCALHMPCLPVCVSLYAQFTGLPFSLLSCKRYSNLHPTFRCTPRSRQTAQTARACASAWPPRPRDGSGEPPQPAAARSCSCCQCAALRSCDAACCLCTALPAPPHQPPAQTNTQLVAVGAWVTA